MRLAVPRVSLTTSPLRLQTEITSSSLSRVAINSVGDSFNRADILRQRKRLRLPENGLALGVDNARRRDAVKLFTARQAVALLLPDGAISLGKSA